MSAMNAEFFDAIEQIEKEKGIPRGYMQEKIQQALLTAFKRDNPDCEDNVEVIMDENKKTISMFVLKTIVEESEYVNDATQILLDEARHYDKKAGIGDTVRIPVETKKFGRIAAQALIKSDFRITREHGVWFDIGARRYMATFHPSALLRDPFKRPDAFTDLRALRSEIRALCTATY